MNRYFFGLFAVIALIIVIIVLIVSGGNSTKVPHSTRTLESFANDPSTAVRLTIDGPINATQNHSQVQITVSNSVTNGTVYQGYNGSVVQSQNYGNTQTAFSSFLSALDKAGFTKGNDASTLKSEQGYCPLGDRYIMEVMTNGKDIERYWSTNCGGDPHSFDGDLGLTLTLFQNQVPNYADLTNNASL